jgi:hypothetical protein
MFTSYLPKLGALVRMSIHAGVVLLGAGLSMSATAYAAAAPKLAMAWPAEWQAQPLVLDNQRYYLWAAQRVGNVEKQQLLLSVFTAVSMREPWRANRIKEMALLLRDGTAPLARERELQLQPFADGSGFYFVATHKAELGPGYRQLVQGVWRSAGYVFNFVLQTNDATSADTRAVLGALQALRVGSTL